MEPALVSLSPRDLRRLSVLERIAAGDPNQVQAAAVLGLSARQIKRLVRKLRLGGPAALASQHMPPVCRPRDCGRLGDGLSPRSDDTYIGLRKPISSGMVLCWTRPASRAYGARFSTADTALVNAAIALRASGSALAA